MIINEILKYLGSDEKVFKVSDARRQGEIVY